MPEIKVGDKVNVYGSCDCDTDGLTTGGATVIKTYSRKLLVNMDFDGSERYACQLCARKLKQRGPDKTPRTRRTFAELGKQSRCHYISFGVNDAERAAIMSKLDATGLTMTDYIRSFIPETMEE